MDAHVGQWLLDESVGFESYLKVTGFPENLISVAIAAKPTLHVTKEGDFLVWKQESNGNVLTSKVDLNGVETENNGLFGVKTLSKAKVEGGKLTVHVTFEDQSKKPLVLTEEVIDGRLSQTINVNNGEAICTRVYKRV